MLRVAHTVFAYGSCLTHLQVFAQKSSIISSTLALLVTFVAKTAANDPQVSLCI